ncbi:DUF1741-domain-containing protein [Piedraia hortae CBS 480.64]|uniref:DUF1741-domain-containing protein n=1 Tax=Piedraia hortae CBS 480.64 TaxID=1314780 RepID=A0A6A7C4X3_9PEZI|nr:DUF1741-domain-containing protein [Piedraia hortae CBS 480.64]
MESPLTQQTRPPVFEPKVIDLYKKLFGEVSDEEKPSGFWRELLLLKPELGRLREILDKASGDFLLQNQQQSQQLLQHAVKAIKAAQAPADENALDTLIVFFALVLGKKYTSPSSDVIEVLAGLDKVDSVFNELVAVLDDVIDKGRSLPVRQKAVRTAIAVVSGSYKTALITYFFQRDFFPALMKLVQQLDSPLQAAEPLLLTGLLANNNKFEAQNQYRVRFADFVNDGAMGEVVESVAWTCTLLRARYIGILDDTPVGWSLTGALSYVGLGALAGTPAVPVLAEEQQKELFSEQPGPESAILLTLYDFVLANRLFRHRFTTQPPAFPAEQPPPISSFLSLTSYLSQHAHRSARAVLYSYTTCLILLILVQDSGTAKALCETSGAVRLCRQRPPHLPPGKWDNRPYASAILDILVDGINHNLRKRLDVGLYMQFLTTMSHLLSYLSKTRTKLPYHWSELWRSLLSFARFLEQYHGDLKTLSGSQEVVELLVQVLHRALTSGEAFLLEAKEYDDLLYKLVESGEALTKLSNSYQLSKSESESRIKALIGVSTHYNELIEEHKAKQDHLSPKGVIAVIKQGYETLNIESNERVDGMGEYREADHKATLKRIVRVAAADAVVLALKHGER